MTSTVYTIRSERTGAPSHTHLCPLRSARGTRPGSRAFGPACHGCHGAAAVCAFLTGARFTNCPAAISDARKHSAPSLTNFPLSAPKAAIYGRTDSGGADSALASTSKSDAGASTVDATRSGHWRRTRAIAAARSGNGEVRAVWFAVASLFCRGNPPRSTGPASPSVIRAEPAGRGRTAPDAKTRAEPR